VYSFGSGLAQVTGFCEESNGKVWCVMGGNYLTSLEGR
jgi:hypothetical protein